MKPAVLSRFDQPAQLWRRVMVLALLCVTLTLLIRSDDLHMALLNLLDASKTVMSDHPLLGAVVFVSFAALSAMLAFVSAAIVVPIATYVWGAPLSVLLLWLGWLLGGMSAYVIGRYLGRPVVRWLTADIALQRIERYLHRDTRFGLVLLLQLALPSELPGYLLGLAVYPFGRYLLSLGLAELPYAIVTVYLGAGFIDRNGPIILLMGAVLILLSVLAYYILRKHLAHQNNTTST